MNIGLFCKWLILLLGLIVLCRSEATDGDYPFPKITPSFETIIEIKVHKNASTLLLNIKEFVASENHQYKLQLIQDGKNVEFLYLPETREVLEAYGKNCTVKSITESSFLSIIGMNDLKSGSSIDFFIPSTTLMLSDNNVVFKGKEKIREIDTKFWQRNFYWDAFQGYFKINYYFLESSSMTGKAVPIRITMEGLQRNELFIHTYDYIAFQSDTADEFTFLTPPGVFCKRHEARPIPHIPDFFSYTEEITVPLIKSVQRREVYFYQSAKLFRMDYRSKIPTAPFYSTNLLTVIQDFNSGIEYTIDLVQENCSMAAINSSRPTAPANLSHIMENSDKVIILGKPDQYFHLDESYVFVGNRNVRGIKGEVWISERSDFYIINYGTFNKTIHEITLISEEWQGDSDETEHKFIPIRSVITVYDNLNITKANFEVHFDIYDFEERIPDMLAFDVSSCYPKSSDRKYFEIAIPGSYLSFENIGKEKFTQAVHQVIVQHAKTSALRITKLMIDYNSTFIYATALMTERPSVLFEFIWLKNHVFPNNNDKTIANIASIEDCALACLNETNFKCMSADYCGSFYCFLSKDFNECSLEASANCHILIRNDLDGMVDITSIEAYQNLKQSIEIKNFSICLQNTNGTKTQLYASSIRDDIFSGKWEFDNDSSYKIKFNILQPEHKISFLAISRMENDMSLFGCLDLCLNEENFRCETLTWCSRSSECFLSTKYTNEFGESDIVEDSRCSVYAREYSKDYTVHNGFILTESNFKITTHNINNAEVCARMCIKENKIKCRSFEFCPISKTCFLMHSHLLDKQKPSTVSNGLCSHYSKIFGADFKKTARKELEGRDDITVFNLSAEECAKECIDILGNDCASYDYCPQRQSKRTCFISKSHATDKGINIIDSVCDHYSRQYKEDGMAVSKNRIFIPDTTPFSWGAVSGIACAVFIFGIITTIAAFKMHDNIRKRKTASRAMKLSFVNKSYSNN